MDQLLPVIRGKRDFRDTGSMDTAEAEDVDLASMETPTDKGKESEENGIGRRNCAEVRIQRAWSVVERGGIAYESGLPKEVFRKHESCESAGQKAVIW
jgi:hypothetical protein